MSQSDVVVQNELSTADLVKRPSGGTSEVASNGSNERHLPLFSDEAANELRGNWSRIQASFVDEPRSAVEQADHLVATAIQRLAETFANERANLEREWSQGQDVSTEDLRQALRRYRSFFDRLLSA